MFGLPRPDCNPREKPVSFDAGDVLGHHIKVKAVADFASLVVVKDLQEFLGMVNFHHRLIPHAGHFLHPLYDALHSRKSTVWTPDWIVAFDRAKSALTSPAFLAHPDSNAPIVLTTVASG